MGGIISRARMRLGTETLRCPRCRKPVSIEIHTDLPDRDWLSCSGCDYRAVIDFIPILDKYGLPHGLSRPEKRQFAEHLQKNIAKL